MNFINILRKLQTLLEKEELVFFGHLQNMNSKRLTERIFKYIIKFKMANTWMSEAEDDIEELQISHENIAERKREKHKEK